jgi:hypothetical protein
MKTVFRFTRPIFCLQVPDWMQLGGDSLPAPLKPQSKVNLSLKSPIRGAVVKGKGVNSISAEEQQK